MIDLKVFTDKQLFFGLSENQLQMIADVAEVKVYSPGDIIIHEGGVGDSIALVVSGKVELTKKKNDGSEVNLGTYSKGAFFGEMTLINVEHRSATIKAVEDAVVILLKNTALGEIFKADRELFIVLLINITRILSKRLRQANERLMEV